MYTLAIDQGTHASRAILFDNQGEIVDSENQEIHLNRIDKKHIEQDAEEILNSILAVMNRLFQRLPETAIKQITACGLCTQRSTVVAFNQQGKALMPALSWQDVRGEASLEQLSDFFEDIQLLSGLPVSPHYGATKLKYLNDALGAEDDEVYTAPLVSYLLYNLVEGKPYQVDHSNAQRTQLMDVSELTWSEELKDYFDIEHMNLPELSPISKNYGNLINHNKVDNDISLTTVCGDQNAAFFGAGDLGEMTALVNLGSGAFVLRSMPEMIRSKSQLSGVSYSDESFVTYLREGTVNGSGTALSWAKEKYQLGDLKTLLPSYFAMAKDNDIPVFINAVGGLGSPWWKSNIEPHWLLNNEPAFDTNEQKALIAVAVVESILFLVFDNIQLMQKDREIKALRLSGGLSKSNELCQQLANLTQLSVERVDNPEATARGVAWLAAGKPKWDEIPIETFEPIYDPTKGEALISRYKKFHNALLALCS